MPHTSLRGRRHHDCTHGRLLYAAVHFAFVLTSLTPAAAAETDPTSDQNPFLPAPGTHAGWTFLRGPDYDGHSPEIHLADSWPEDGPPVLWTRELGQGYSAFAASGRRVYTQAQTLGGQFVYCLDAETGETLWEYRYAWPYEPLGVYPGPRSSPTLAGGHVYFTGPDGLTGCLTAGKGQLVWQRNVVEEYHGRGGTGFGYSCTPVVIDGLVILPVGGKSASMVALDATDGSEVWAAGNDPPSPLNWAAGSWWSAIWKIPWSCTIVSPVSCCFASTCPRDTTSIPPGRFIASRTCGPPVHFAPVPV